MSNLQIKFKILCYTHFRENVYIVVNSYSQGNCDINKSIKLNTNCDLYPIWESNFIIFDSKNANLEYKYVVRGNDNNNIKWEEFPDNRKLDLTNLNKSIHYIINDGEFSKKQLKIEKVKLTANKSNEKSQKHKKNDIKDKKEKNIDNKNKNYQYQNTNAEQYVKSRRDEIKNIDIKNYNTNIIYSETKITDEIKNFINILIQRNSEENTWREKLSFTCELINTNDSNDQIISLIATYLYFVNSGQIKCSEDGTHFRPNHSAKHAFNIFKKLYKKYSLTQNK